MSFTKFRLPIALGFVAIAITIAILTPEPDRSLRSAQCFHDFLHIPGFAAVAAALFWAFPNRRGSPRKRKLRRLLLLSAIAIGLGVFVELMQQALGGVADPVDVMHDVAGVTASLLVAISLWSTMRTTARVALRVGALVVSLGFLPPTLLAWGEEQRAKRAFPILADFRDARELERFEWRDAVPSAIGGDSESDGLPEPGLSLLLLAAQYPGFTLRYFPRDWSAYARLVIECDDPDAFPLDVSVRIDDMAHDESFGDRYNKNFTLQPGRNSIEIPLDDVARAPRTRRLDLSKVRTVIVFAHDLQSPRKLTLRSIRLSE